MLRIFLISFLIGPCLLGLEAARRPLTLPNEERHSRLLELISLILFPLICFYTNTNIFWPRWEQLFHVILLVLSRTRIHHSSNKQLFVKPLLAAPSQLTMTEILQMLADNYIFVPLSGHKTHHKSSLSSFNTIPHENHLKKDVAFLFHKVYAGQCQEKKSGLK